MSLKPRRAGLVGPLFYWELVRLARRAQDTRARIIFTAGLFAVLTIFTVLWFSDVPVEDLFLGTSRTLTLEQSARFGDRFATTFLIGQLVILSALTPAYAAGGISEDKERKTLDYILISELSNREIVFGKFLGRLVFLLGIMFSGLPILSLTLLYGGVSSDLLFASYLLTATTVILLASISAASAAVASTYRGALFRAYGISAVHLLLGCGHPAASPVLVVVYLTAAAGTQGIWLIAGVYSGVQLLASGGAVYVAVRSIRKLRASPGYALKPPRKVVRPELTPIVLTEDAADETLPVARRVKVKTPRRDAPRRPRRPQPPPRIPAVMDRPAVDADDPFAWKERYTTGLKPTADDNNMRAFSVALGIKLAAIVVLIAALALISMTVAQSKVAPVIFLLPGFVVLLLYLVLVGTSACGMVLREQQRMTLESLLTIPVDRHRMLAPKWQVSARRGWYWGLLAQVLLFMGYAVTENPFTGLVAFPFIPAAAFAAASYGLWLSIRSATQTRATLWLMILILAVLIGLGWVWLLAEGRDLAIAESAAAAGTGLLLVIAAGFWLLAKRDFERLARD